MNKYHIELLREIKKHSSQRTKHQKERDKSYIGTDKFCYSIKSRIKRQIIKDWIKRHSNLSILEFTNLLNSLYRGKSHDEISTGGRLLEYLPKLRKQINPKLLDNWLNRTRGWGEVDSICQSKFTADNLLLKWKDWKSLIVKLSKDKNPNKKRASLVLLTKPVRDLRDARLINLVFSIIDRLKGERDILITKAISWLLRDSIENYRQGVVVYLNKNSGSLPKIAVRETRNKLRTGRK